MSEQPIERFELRFNVPPHGEPAMVPDGALLPHADGSSLHKGEAGHWVRYSDHASRIAEKDARIEELENRLNGAFAMNARLNSREEEQASLAFEWRQRAETASEDTKTQADRADQAETRVTEMKAEWDNIREEKVDNYSHYLKAIKQAEAAESRFTAFLDALTGDAAVEAARKIRQEQGGITTKNLIQAARTAALEEIKTDG